MDRRSQGRPAGPFGNSRSALVGFQNAEDTAFSIRAICQIADARNRHFRNGHLAAGGDYLFCEFVHRWNVDGVDVAAGSALTGETAVNTWLTVLTCGDHPVIHWSFPSLEFPPKNVLVKCSCSFGVCCVDLEIDNSRHRNSSPV